MQKITNTILNIFKITDMTDIAKNTQTANSRHI